MKRTHVQVLVIGAGPAGLSAAISCQNAGADVLLVDSNAWAGGQLFKQIHKFFGSSAHQAGTRGFAIGKELLQKAQQSRVTIWLNSTVIGADEGRQVVIERGLDTSAAKTLEIVVAEKIVIATGASENAIRFSGWDIPGVMGAGALQTMVNVHRVLPGKRVLMIGSGNVGLIVSYQLMQAGAQVVALVEAAPKIGGYGVHAAKIARAGVPILTSHTVFAAHGTDRVTGATICQVDERFQPIPGAGQEVEVDTVALAVGLTPLPKLARMFGCQMRFIPAFSGWVPLHSDEMESSAEGVFVAGDVTGIEEASTALEEGRLAGIGIAAQLGLIPTDEAERQKKEIWDRLDGLRSGGHGVMRQKAKRQQIDAYVQECKKGA